MSVKSTLRERRRMQTSREIQRSAISLSLSLGYDHVTTEMIAAEAGVSLRTFFNYYPNKEAAIVGPGPGFGDEMEARFKSLSGPLLHDMLEALRTITGDEELDRGTAQLIDRLLLTAPELVPLFYDSLKRLRDKIVGMAVARLGTHALAEAELLAEAISYALADTLRIWANDEQMPAERIVDVVADKLMILRRLLETA